MAKTAGEITLEYSAQLSAVSERCRRRRKKLGADRQTALLALEAAQPALAARQADVAEAESARTAAYEKAKTDQADAGEAARFRAYDKVSAADVEYQAATHIQEYQARKVDIELEYSRTLKSVRQQSPGLGDRQKARRKARDIRRAALDKAELEFTQAKRARFNTWQKSQAAANGKHITAIETARRRASQAVTAADRAFERAVDAANRAYVSVLKTLPAVAALEERFAERRTKAEKTCRQQKRDVRERMKAELAGLTG